MNNEPYTLCIMCADGRVCVNYDMHKDTALDIVDRINSNKLGNLLLNHVHVWDTKKGTFEMNASFNVGKVIFGYAEATDQRKMMQKKLCIC